LPSSKESSKITLMEGGCRHELEISLLGPEIFSWEGPLVVSWLAPCGGSGCFPEVESSGMVVVELE
jgi:hypothetical protein